MDSIFIARGSPDAIPIWFVTAANYGDVRKMIGGEGCAFADAAGFEIAPEYDCGYAQPQRAKITLEVGFHAADDHVGEFGNRVQHLFIDG